MNTLSTVSNYTIEQFQSNTLVNTISFEKTSDMDVNKENIYPLVNIDLVNSTVTENEISVYYTITIVEDRNIEPVLNNDKLFGSNLIDNLNECHTIAVKFINELNRQNNDLGIELTQLSTLNFLKLYGGVLDGVRFNVTLSIENDISSC